MREEQHVFLLGSRRIASRVFKAEEARRAGRGRTGGVRKKQQNTTGTRVYAGCIGPGGLGASHAGPGSRGAGMSRTSDSGRPTRLM